MKKNYFKIVFLLFFIIDCAKKEKPSSLNNNDIISQVSSFTNSMDNAPQIAEYVVDIFEDKKGNLWFGTMGKGVARYDGNILTYFSTKDGLCGNTVASIA